jgi:hypothetical protein
MRWSATADRRPPRALVARDPRRLAVSRRMRRWPRPTGPGVPRKLPPPVATMRQPGPSAVGPLGAAGAARAAGYGVRFLRYPNAGGFGINLERDGKRFFTADVHRFTPKRSDRRGCGTALPSTSGHA